MFTTDTAFARPRNVRGAAASRAVVAVDAYGFAAAATSAAAATAVATDLAALSAMGLGWAKRHEIQVPRPAPPA